MKDALPLQFSEILADIDRERNENIDVESLTKISRDKLWWRCKNGHAYQVSVFSRVRSNGCKECNKAQIWSRITYKNQQKGKYARLVDKGSTEILSLWDASQNSIPIDEISAGSSKKYKWKCPEGHVWEAAPKSLLRGTRCPQCLRKTIAFRNQSRAIKRSGSLYDARPDLRAEWDPANDVNIDEVSPGSNKRIKWICKYGHKWEATIGNRVGRNSGCPFCTSQTSRLEIYLLVQLRSIFPNVLWRNKVDGREIDILLRDNNIGIEVDGEYWHRNKVQEDVAKEDYLTRVHDLKVVRVRPIELPVVGAHSVAYTRKDEQQKICMNLVEHLEKILPCSVEITQYLQRGVANNLEDYLEMVARLPAPVDGTSLADLYPNLVDEWDTARNKPLTPDLFSPSSAQKVYWTCVRDHSFQATIKNRTNRGSGCPICNDEGRSSRANLRYFRAYGTVAEVHPHLVKYWDPELNGGIEASEASSTANSTFTWCCVNGHRFRRVLKNMVNNPICRVCSSIQYSNPELLVDWDYDKNSGITPDTVQPKSSKVVWWRCVNGHSWNSTVAARTSDGKTCPICRSLGFRRPELLAGWDYSKNSSIDPNLIAVGTSVKVWWLCPEGHTWSAAVSSRTGKESGCPVCANLWRVEAMRTAKKKSPKREG